MDKVASRSGVVTAIDVGKAVVLREDCASAQLIEAKATMQVMNSGRVRYLIMR